MVRHFSQFVSYTACVALAVLSGCAEPGERCNPDHEIDVRLASLPVGRWRCADYYEVTIDAMGKPRKVAGSLGYTCFSCNVDDHFPLVLGDRNVRAGKQPDLGGKAWVGYSRELGDVQLESGYLLLTYEVGFTDARKKTRQFAFRVDENGALGYAGPSILDFPLKWHTCEPVAASDLASDDLPSASARSNTHREVDEVSE